MGRRKVVISCKAALTGFSVALGTERHRPRTANTDARWQHHPVSYRPRQAAHTRLLRGPKSCRTCAYSAARQAPLVAGGGRASHHEGRPISGHPSLLEQTLASDVRSATTRPAAGSVLQRISSRPARLSWQRTCGSAEILRCQPRPIPGTAGHILFSTPLIVGAPLPTRAGAALPQRTAKTSWLAGPTSPPFFAAGSATAPLLSESGPKLMRPARLRQFTVNVAIV